ncbi:MAG: 30S ribosomal protein THX [Chitinophagales bacterium]|nr:30S ribosomal protein THX [Chitinophagales bacterium]
MGKGDKKSKKGKIFKGSYGNSRKRKTETTPLVKPATVTESEPPKAEPVKRTVRKKEPK